MGCLDALSVREQRRYTGPAADTMALQRALAHSLRRYGPKLESDARNGVDETRALAIVAKLAAQPVHRHPHHVTRRGVVIAPHVPRQRGRGDDAVEVAHQVFQEPELGPGKRGQPGLLHEEGKKIDELPVVIDNEDPDALTGIVLGSTHPA